MLPTLIERRRRQVSDGAASALLVVDLSPRFSDATRFGDGFELVGVQHFAEVGSVEALDVGVLLGMAGLGEVPADASLGCPVLPEAGQGAESGEQQAPPTIGRIYDKIGAVELLDSLLVTHHFQPPAPLMQRRMRA